MRLASSQATLKPAFGRGWIAERQAEVKMYFEGTIYSVVQRDCPRCGFSYREGIPVGRTTKEGTDAGLIEPVQSPFYFRSTIDSGAKIVFFKESKGGGCYSRSHFDFLLKICGKWYLAASKVIKSSEGEPFFKGLIPHEISVYHQEGGDRGHFYAIEAEPLPVNHRQKRLCPACNRYRQEIKEERTRISVLVLDQKIGCQNIFWHPERKVFLCWGNEYELYQRYELYPEEAARVPHRLVLTCGGLPFATLWRRGVHIEVTKPYPYRKKSPFIDDQQEEVSK